MLNAPEVSTQNPEDPADQQNDLPPQTDAAPSEVMDTNADPTASHDPPSPILVKPT